MSTIKTRSATKSQMGYLVKYKTYPSGFGCYSGQNLDQDAIDALSSTKTTKVYATKEEAIAKARKLRSKCDQFDGWDDAGLPPYSSADHPSINLDEDENVLIWVEDIAKKKKKEQDAIDKARKSKRPKVNPSTTSATAAKKQIFGHVHRDLVFDIEMFSRNPCRVKGGASHPPGAYGRRCSERESFAYLIQRLSDRNYTMRSVCLEDGGAPYTTYKRRNVTMKLVVFLPGESNLNAHANDVDILDACHLDLISCNTGECQLTATNLTKAASADTKCIFLNGYKDSDSIVKVIKKCPHLQCISLNECDISDDILKALSKCRDLRGFTMAGCENYEDATDAVFASFLRACPKLSWLFVDDNDAPVQVFGIASWNALGSGACPLLKVLWVDGTDVAKATVRKGLNSRKLKLCMINPDKNIGSSF